MSKKTKYDIMGKELKGTYKTSVALIFKLLSITNKLKNKPMNDDNLDFEVVSLLNEILPVALTLAHIGYENNKDLQTIDKKSLFSYMESKNISATEFSYNYSKKLTENVKLLLLFAIIEKENINLPDLKDPEIAIKLLEGQCIESIFDPVIDELSIESANILYNVFSDDFNINDLNQEQKLLIESYHEKYMNKYIYPKVTKDDVKEKTIMRLAKGFGKSKR